MVAYKNFGLAVTVVFGIAGTAMAEPRDSSNVAFLEARNVDYVGSIDLERRDRKGAVGALAQNSAQLANSMGRSSKAGPNSAVASLAKSSARVANGMGHAQRRGIKKRGRNGSVSTLAKKNRHIRVD